MLNLRDSASRAVSGFALILSVMKEPILSGLAAVYIAQPQDSSSPPSSVRPTRFSALYAATRSQAAGFP